jgi:hypothetical protein
LGGLWWVASAIRAANDRDAARTQLKIERDSILTLCTTKSDEAAVAVIEDAGRTFEAHLSASPLDFDEREQILAGFQNQLEVRGCGTNARFQVKGGHHSKSGTR